MQLIVALKQPFLLKKVSFEWLFCVVFCCLTLRSILNSFSNPFLPFFLSEQLLDVLKSYSPSLESIALSFAKMLASFNHGLPWPCHKVDCCGLMSHHSLWYTFLQRIFCFQKKLFLESTYLFLVFPKTVVSVSGLYSSHKYIDISLLTIDNCSTSSTYFFFCPDKTYSQSAHFYVQSRHPYSQSGPLY